MRGAQICTVSMALAISVLSDDPVMIEPTR
jgi:hypothetical protein